MADRLMQALHTLDEVERMARRRSPLRRIDARAKIIVTVAFLLSMLSMPLLRLADLMLFAIYPIISAAMCGMSYTRLARTSLLAVPFAVLIALPNIFYDRTPIMHLGQIAISRGWIMLFSITLRGILAVQAVMILMASTGIYPTARALHRMGMPALLASQIYLTMRYLRLIIEQALAMRRARDARSFGRRHYPLKLWATLIGELLIGSIRRGEAVGDAMAIRGFDGRMPAITLNRAERWRGGDTLYVISWSASFVLMHILHLAEHFS